MAIQRLIIDMSGRGGLSSKFFGDVNRHGYTGATDVGTPHLRYIAQDGQMVSGVYNPVTKYGFLAPSANTFHNITVASPGTAINKTIPINLVDDQLKDIWLCCNNSHIYYAGNYYSFPLTDAVTIGTSLATLETFTDACKYQLNGTEKLFFAWVGDGSEGYISTLDTGDSTGASFNENWSQADVANPMVFAVGTQTLRMIPAGDGYMYILAGNKVHRVDGSTLAGAQGTLYQSVLQGQGGTQFSMGAEFRNKLYIIIKKANVTDDYTTAMTYASRSASEVDSVGVYVWNKQSTFYNSSDFIQIPGAQDVRAIWVNPKGELKIITLESSGECAIRTLAGTQFNITQYLPFGAMPQTIKALKPHGSYTYWLGADANIYGYGSDIGGEKDFLFIVGQVTTAGQGTLIGGSLACVSTNQGDFPLTANYKPSDIFWITYATASNNGFVKTFFPYSYDSVASI